MKLILKVVLASFILCGCSETERTENLVHYVDPMIGTNGIGHTFPGATTPFGMVQLSPDNGYAGWNWVSGYHYSDSTIQGFSHTHLSGPGIGGLGDISIMPTMGEIQLDPGKKNEPDNGYRSRFSHKKEEAHAGYYKVTLDDYKVDVELTATPRVGFHRYSYNQAGKGNVIIDPTTRISDRILGSEIEILSNDEIRGIKHIRGGGAGKRDVFFYAKFSKPFDNSKVIDINDSRREKAYVQFDIKEKDTIEIKVALSFVSYEGAKKNFEAEAKEIDFDQALQQAEELWQSKLSKIRIKGSEKQKRTFYTSMYHSYISPNIISDVDGNYIVEGKKYNTDYTQYSNYSTWDTYRALHPLFAIIEHEKTAEIVNSLASRHSVTNLELPKWEMLGFDNRCMPGYSTTSPMADAILKDIKGIHVEEAYAAMKKAAFGTEKNSPNYGGYNGMKEYMYFNYIPSDLVGGSGSKITEQNYYDWLLSEVATKLGHTSDAILFGNRSKGWMYNFNPETKFLWPKTSSGQWDKIKLNEWDGLNRHYISGNIWGYSSYVPHDVSTLISMHGGPEEFAKWLDGVVQDTTTIGGIEHVDISGFIGRYGHGDEPSHHMAYLYNYAKQPWKTQELTREIMAVFYTDQPDGLINNEDLGQMSAWYIFSSLGFYPVCPGDSKYAIGSPIVDEASIYLENGKKFSLQVKNNSDQNKYIQSVRLNGKKYDKNYITHDAILNGGKLVMTMGESPNKEWGTSDDSLPVDLSKVNTKIEEVACYAPYVSTSNYFFSEQQEVHLQCKTEGASIYYTLDGSMPNQNSSRYENPFTIDKSITIKAIAFAEGLKPSAVGTIHYTKSIYPLLEEGYPKIELKNKPKKLGRPDGQNLVDGLYGSLYFKDRKWTALGGKSLEATFDLGKQISISKITITTLTETETFGFPPKNISIYIQNKKGDFVKVASKNGARISGPTNEINRHTLKFRKQQAQLVKVVIEHYGSAPQWHRNAGRRPNLYVDEITIN